MNKMSEFFSSNNWDESHLSQSQDVLSILRARKSVDIIRVLVGGGAVGVAGLAGSSGAARVAGNSRETVLDEFRGSVHINRRHVPEQVGVVQGVLELKNTVLALGGGHLDGNTTAVGVDLPLLAVGAASGSEGLHFTRVLGSGPNVNVGAQVIHDLNIAARSVAGTVGKSSGSSSQDAGDDNVGEEHFEYVVVLTNVVSRKDCDEKKRFLIKRQRRECWDPIRD